MNVGTTKKELNHVLRETPVLVNGTRRWDLRFGVGFMDVVAIPSANVFSVLTMDDHGRLTVAPVEQTVADKKHAQVRGISVIKGGKHQLQLTDGRTVLVDAKSAKTFTRGASVVISVPKGTVASVHAVEPKATVILTSGKHRGKRGVVEAIDGEFVTVATAEGPLSTKQTFAFVLTSAAAGGAQ
jgi:ribosomal protein S4E